MKLEVAAAALACLLTFWPVKGQDLHPERASLYRSNPSKANDTPKLIYVVEPTKAAHYSRTRVTLTFRGDSSGRSKLLLPPGWFGGDSEGKSVRDLRILSPGARFTDSREATSREIAHRPSEEVTVEYVVDQARPPGAEVSSSPKPYFYQFGEALWVLPDWDKKKPISFVLQWKNFPEGWSLANSYGSEHRQEFRDTIERFQHGTYLGGDFRLRPFRVGSKTLLLAVRGRPAFTDEDFKDFLCKLYAAEADFWEDDDFLYTFIVCVPTDTPAGNFGGEGRTNSFSVHLSVHDNLGFGVKHLLAHELFHSWNPTKLRWDGQQSYWFTEGFTDYYATLMVLRAGSCTLEDGIDFFDRNLKAYYLSPARNYSYDRLMKDRDSYEVDRLIYSRGLLQALNWNADIRRATKGDHSLDDAMHALSRAARRNKGFTLTNRTIADALRPYLGERVEQDLRRNVLAGETIRPCPDALGPHVQLSQIMVPTFTLGFDPNSLSKKVVSGIEPASNAHRAGLRDGQAIVAGGYSPGAADQLVKLRIRDGNAEKTIRFYPRGQEVAVPQFQLNKPLSTEERAACLAWLGVPSKSQ